MTLQSRNPYLIAFGILLLIAAFGAWRYYALAQGYRALQSDFASTTLAYQDAAARVMQLTGENDDLSSDLRAEKRKNDDFEDQISDISSTVGTLTKLSETDPELLQKYSKVYFLNENYVPSGLSNINKKYLYDQSRTLRFHEGAYPALRKMLNDAADDDIDILVASAYRSFNEQTTLKAGYKVTYGTGANAFSAEQGYSEHQLGTAVDFTTKSLAGGLDGFDQTPAYAWLVKHADRYGFVLSYPKGNAFYQYEPWHWRYVGRDLAEDLHDDGKYFYDLDQRTIDTYLLSIFD